MAPDGASIILSVKARARIEIRAEMKNRLDAAVESPATPAIVIFACPDRHRCMAILTDFIGLAV